MFSFLDLKCYCCTTHLLKGKNVSKICALCKFSNDYCLHIPYDFNSCIFSEKQLASAIWAYLSMIKIIQFPFIERFEYIIVSVWAFYITQCFLYIMGSKSWYKRGTGNKAKICFASYHPIHLCFIIFLNNRNKINLLNTWTGQMGFVYIYVYLPVLWLIQTAKIKLRR